MATRKRRRSAERRLQQKYLRSRSKDRENNERAAYAAAVESTFEDKTPKVARLTSEIRSFFKQYQCEPLLANLLIDVYARPINSEAEESLRHPSVTAEWASWLYLTTESIAKVPSTLDAETYIELLQQLRRAVDLQHQNLLRDAVSGAPNEAERRLRARIAAETLIVRWPAYPEHLSAEMTCLFNSYDEPLRDAGLRPISECLVQVRSLESLVEDRLNQALNFAARIARAQTAPGASLAVPGEFGADVRNALFDRAAAIATVRPGDLAAYGLDERSASSLLEAFSLARPQKLIGDSRPGAYAPIEERPIIDLGEGAFLCHLAPKLRWAVLRRYEAALMGSQARHAYERSRARYLETEAISVIQGVSQHARSGHSLRYWFDDGSGEHEFEVDGLVVDDDTVFIIEAKAGRVRPPAARGAPSLREDLKSLVTRAHDQALRVEAYIRSRDEAEFMRRDGSAFKVEGCTRFILVTPTLDSLSACVTRLVDMEQAGLLADGRLPWSVCLHDLRVITECVAGMGELVHYHDRRMRVEGQNVDAHDELDWFGNYLQSGLYFQPGSKESIFLSSFTGIFDNYYMSKERRPGRGVRGPPRQMIPKYLGDLVGRLEAQGPPGYLAAVLAILDANGKSRDRLERLFRERKHRSLASGFSATRALFGKRLLVYAAVDVHMLRIDLDEYRANAMREARAEELVMIVDHASGRLSVSTLGLRVGGRV